MFSGVQYPTSSIEEVYPYNTRIAEREVQAYLESAQRLADDILGPEKSLKPHCCNSIGTVKVRHFWSWWPMSPFYYMDPYPYYGRGIHVHSHHDSDAGLRILVGLAAAVLGGYAIFKAAEGLGKWKEANQELKENQEFKRNLRNYNNQFAQTHFGELRQISELKDKIFSRIKSEALSNLIYMTSLVAASALALAGAIVTSGALIVAGVAVAAGTGTLMLCDWGFNSVNRQHIRDAWQIRQCLASLLSVEQ